MADGALGAEYVTPEPQGGPVPDNAALTFVAEDYQEQDYESILDSRTSSLNISRVSSLGLDINIPTSERATEEISKSQETRSAPDTRLEAVNVSGHTSRRTSRIARLMIFLRGKNGSLFSG